MIVSTLMADYCPQCLSTDLILTNVNYSVLNDIGGTTCRSFVIQECVNCGEPVGQITTQAFLDLLNKDRNRTNKHQPSLFEGNTGEEF